MLSWLLVAFWFPLWQTPASLLHTSIGYPLAAVGCAAFLVATLHASEGGARFLLNRGLIYLGRISYGLYVYHWPVLLIAKMFCLFLVRAAWLPHSLWFARLAFLLTAALLTFIAAAASYHWLEAPFLRLKGRFTYVESRPV